MLNKHLLVLKTKIWTTANILCKIDSRPDSYILVSDSTAVVPLDAASIVRGRVGRTFIQPYTYGARNRIKVNIISKALNVFSLV